MSSSMWHLFVFWRKNLKHSLKIKKKKKMSKKWLNVTFSLLFLRKAIVLACTSLWCIGVFLYRLQDPTFPFQSRTRTQTMFWKNQNSRINSVHDFKYNSLNTRHIIQYNDIIQSQNINDFGSKLILRLIQKIANAWG